MRCQAFPGVQRPIHHPITGSNRQQIRTSDIVIEAAKVRIVIEAKIGKAEPDATQLLKYADDAAKWKNFRTRVVASLTAGELSPSTVDEVTSKLPRRPEDTFRSNPMAPSH